MPNRLANESSPYLLQHAEDPVDWWPWSRSAFDQARERDVPVLLSIGYASCHWCHVMAHESFSDPDTAAVMNSDFVNIKVDREERPDIDAIYMDAVTTMTGHGGWPLTVFLDADGRPFFGGTYFPPDDRAGMPSFRNVLKAIKSAWQTDRMDVERQAARLVELIAPPSIASRELLDSTLIENALGSLHAKFDYDHGGFGVAPKFPHLMNLSFCLACGYPSDSRTLGMVRKSLEAMALGGIYDQVGSGFSRYAVDAKWRVPHFEKMLSDNAQLARLYLWAGIALDSAFFLRIATETLEFVLREMRDPSGGFYSSIDADSEGKEGKYYLWSFEEFCEVAGPDLVDFYGVTSEGQLDGLNVLSAASEIEILDSDRREQILAARRRLFERRSRRVPPSIDTNIVSAWCGLAISAFADASRVLKRSDFLATAESCGNLCRNELFDGERLLRTMESAVPGFAQDFALVALGYLSLFEATGDWDWVDSALSLANILFADFRDPVDGLLYTTAAEDLITRPKELLDNSEPSASAAGAELALKLARLTSDKRLEEFAEEIMSRIAHLVPRAPGGFGSILQVMARYLAEPVEIIVTSEEFAAIANHHYLPFATFVPGITGADMDNPLLSGKSFAEGSMGYICNNYVCSAPIRDSSSFDQALKFLSK